MSSSNDSKPTEPISCFKSCYRMQCRLYRSCECCSMQLIAPGLCGMHLSAVRACRDSAVVATWYASGEYTLILAQTTLATHSKSKLADVPNLCCMTHMVYFSRWWSLFSALHRVHRSPDARLGAACAVSELCYVARVGITRSTKTDESATSPPAKRRPAKKHSSSRPAKRQTKILRKQPVGTLDLPKQELSPLA